MNFTILLFLCLLTFTALWLSAKFLGKIGLYIFASVTFLLASYLVVGTSSFLTANVGLDICFFIPAFFTLYLITKKYGLGDGIKLGITLLSISLLNAATWFVYKLYLGFPFFTALAAFTPFLISLLALVVAVAIIFLLYRNKNVFAKFKESFRAFLILAIAIAANTFIFVMITEATLSVGFLQILLDFFITYLWQVLILGGLVLFSNLAIKINDNSNFGDTLKQKFDEAILKTKETIKNATQKEDEEIDEAKVIEVKEEQAEEKIDEIIEVAEEEEKKEDKKD